ncbi:MAG: lytic murein transglycosylase [Patescibacteria group bacterium]
MAMNGVLVYAQATTQQQVVEERRTKLMRELEALESEIGNYQNLIGQKQGEAATLERDITVLNSKIKQTKLQIRSLDVTLETLQDKIIEKEGAISGITAKVGREKRSLAELLRTYQAYDDVSVIELLLSYEHISDFLQDIDAVNAVQQSLQGSFEELRSVKKLEEEARDELQERHQEQGQLRVVQDLEKKRLEGTEKEQKTLLKVTKGKESEYQKVVKEKKKDAASIRSELFLLQGSPSIKFEEAMAYADRASAKTGVRAAFILGVVAQESELGKNIGQCNLPDDPPKYRWQAIMKPTRDIEPYKRITSELGLDPEKMPLSCPMSVGWGGAMGPAQFIPSTWEGYKSRIATATNHNPPNPWSAEDAFMAAGLYLGDIGANTRAGEHTAAAKYFAGSNWKSALGNTYANQVLEKVEKYQGQLDILRGVASL